MLMFTEICKMQILVVSATDTEIQGLRDKFPEQEILITGVGAPQTILQLCKRFSQSDYQAVIQVGIAGSFKESLANGEVVAVYRDRFADLGVVEKDQIEDLVEKGLASSAHSPYSAGWKVNSSSLIEKIALKKVSAVTVNLVGNTPELTRMISEKYNPEIETMEGAAFHFSCTEYRQPFLQLRAISNTIGERDKSRWKIKEAIENLNRELLRVIHQLKTGSVVNEAYNDH